MNWKLSVLNKIVEWLVGGEVFEFVKNLVATINDSALTGEQKRAQTFTQTRQIFGSLATVLINLAIEVAVLLLKSKIEAQSGN
tara:strand:- start:506 stop:754 length:249 start_codon:yes stop_codon:yes gene_type:complete